jgi:hypothetical protein
MTHFMICEALLLALMTEDMLGVSPLINQLLCTILCVPNLILVSALKYFGVYCYHLQGAQCNSNFFTT